MPFRALDSIHLGHRPPVQAGEVIPDTFTDMHGDEQPVDFDRLVDLGVAEKVSAAEAKKSPAAGEADDDAAE